MCFSCRIQLTFISVVSSSTMSEGSEEANRNQPINIKVRSQRGEEVCPPIYRYHCPPTSLFNALSFTHP